MRWGVPCLATNALLSLAKKYDKKESYVYTEPYDTFYARRYRVVSL